MNGNNGTEYNETEERQLVKITVKGIAKGMFLRDLEEVLPNIKMRKELYDKVMLYHNRDKVPELIKTSIQDYLLLLNQSLAKAESFSKAISDHFNKSFSVNQIMRSFKGVEEQLTYEHTKEEYVMARVMQEIVDKVEDTGFEALNSEDFSIKKSGLNDNFSAPLPQKTSPVLPGYDVLADLLPSNEPAGNENYAKY